MALPGKLRSSRMALRYPCRRQKILGNLKLLAATTGRAGQARRRPPRLFFRGFHARRNPGRRHPFAFVGQLGAIDGPRKVRPRPT